MRINKKITVFLILLFAVIFLVPNFVSAQDVYGINDFTDANLGTRDLRETLANIVNIVLGFLGILVTLLLLYGGFVWMTSRGDEKRVETAKKILVNAVIGLVIVLASYAIARFVLFGFGGSGGIFGNGNSNGGPGYQGGTGLGAGVLESHYPSRNANNIPRNTNIYVTFREPIDPSFVRTSGCSAGITSCVNDNNIVIRDSAGLVINGDDIAVSVSPDNLVFEFNPYGGGAGLLDVGTHTVRLDGLSRGNGQPAFSLGFYDWQFTVGSETDSIAPRVTSVSPSAGATVPRNSAVQINFSEAINPLFAAGIYPPFTNISISAGSPLNGGYRVTNQYRTVEFIADSLCGTNSCGMDVYCLPGPAALAGQVTDSVVDMAGNSLDGDGDGAAGGDYNWSFNTDNNIDLSAPVIEDMNGGTGANFSLTDPVKITFNKPLLSSSVNSENVQIYQSLLEDTNFWLSLENGRTINIHHDEFKPLTIYTPVLKGEIMDLQQNCWYPCVCDDPSGASCECNQDASVECQAGTHCESINTSGGTGGGLSGGGTPGSCTDADLDGFFAEGGTCGTADLADNDKFLFPGAPEWCDGKDNDGDGTTDPSSVCGPQDCYGNVCKMLLTWASLNAGHSSVLNQYDLVLTNGQNALRGNLTSALMIIHRSIVEAGDWSNAFYGWSIISANSNWFMKDNLGNNTSSRTFIHLWLMDMSQIGYRDFMANQAGDINTTYNGLDGYFYDNYVNLQQHHSYVSDTSGAGNYPGLDIRPRYGSDLAWDSYMEDAAYRMKKSMGNKLIFGNNHGQNYNDHFDGYMVENWIHNQNADGWPNGWYPVTSWQSQMQVAMSANNRNKLLMLQCNNSVHNPAVQNFCFASYLLAKQPNVKTYFSYGFGGINTVNYYPIYDVDLGSPTGAYFEVAAGSYVYRRNFERGVVLVRPTDPAQSNPDVYTYNLGSSYTDAINGGTVSQVSLGDHSAAILLN